MRTTRTTTMRTIAALVAPAVLLLAACGGGGDGPTEPGNPGTPGTPNNDITVANNSFTPASKTVAPGTTVTWTWNSCTSDGYGGMTCTSHNVTFDDGPASSTQDEGSWERAFPTTGTYPYHCTLHGTKTTGMRGTVTVQ